MMHVRETDSQPMTPLRHTLPVAPMAMPEQVLERRRARPALFSILLKRLAWK
ncbi:hypothetical protein ACFPOD_09350 [Nitratireductor kimnyeongensis]|jgi:hypothetical protein|uniref:Uncharacterized protein n=1 Tax=Nitratireductor kimnyeongensis TaxID=430679 RepID=A0ABW0T809_9HYPH|nr:MULTISPECIES: hypothetical protein [Nitratireductor]MCC5779009.1 hypothetical protein [Nitratireductor sp. B36]QZZ36207.1 hypothetical protein KW403_03410 [Nitratireductor kimnyeongensis]